MVPTFSINTGGSRMEAVGASFAYDLTRRISRTEGLDGVQDSQDPSAVPADDGQAEKANQLQKLESALSGTVAYMANTHGEKAASVMVALVYKRLGEGEINELTLGNAFLDVTRFIDRNFGTGAGDAFMAHLNGSLNDSMNDFFDNGLNESFMVAPASLDGGGGVDAAGMLEQLAKEYTEAIKEMLEEARAKPDAGAAAPYTDPARNEPLVGVLKDVVV
ncbi:MAG: hypothetical protein LIP28_04995 [Deltaproteobacteria bacterium]|nr:hypothetical protein [Deltaproteobacteria bacterium]